VTRLVPELLLDGLRFPEGPRWRGDRLWFSDMVGHQVMTVDLQGNTEVIASLATRPSGIGFLPDGRPIVVSMTDGRVLVIEPDGEVNTFADLSGVVGLHLNDMVVDSRGRAYVGYVDDPGAIVLVDGDHAPRVVAEVAFPNGTVITPEGDRLIVAATRGEALLEFDIEADGSLSHRRVFAHIPDSTPDGICLDAEGAVWVGSYRRGEFLRVLAGGTVTDRIDVGGRWALACALGGPDRRTLFLLSSETTMEDFARRQSKGRIETTTVAVPGAGIP